MIEIRPYQLTDAEPLIGLFRELQGFEFALYERMKPPAEIGHWYLDLLERQCLKDAGTILIAEMSKRPVGYATIFTNVVEDGSGDEVSYTYAYVGDLVVTETARRRGIARLLLDECEKIARIAGRDEMRIGVLAANHGARELYRHFGFDDLHVDMRKKLVP